MEPQPINKLTTVEFRAFKNFVTSSFGGRLQFGVGSFQTNDTPNLIYLNVHLVPFLKPSAHALHTI